MQVDDKQNILLEIEVQRLKRRNIFNVVFMGLMTIVMSIFSWRCGAKAGIKFTADYISKMIDEVERQKENEE